MASSRPFIPATFLRNISIRFSFIPLVAVARIDRTSAMIFASSSVTAGLGGTLVYILRRSKKLLILPKSLASTSRFITVPFAACERCSTDAENSISKLTTRRIQIPEKMIFVGGNTEPALSPKVAESALRIFTVGSSHLVSRSSLLRD
ncbi:hypothetical protein EDB87DRAFT_1652393 [Lactarius vividus]|nr:hypothetical protein EDB87DRAFT_1652393 [Lactarius vividus]